MTIPNILGRQTFTHYITNYYEGNRSSYVVNPVSTNPVSLLLCKKISPLLYSYFRLFRITWFIVSFQLHAFPILMFVNITQFTNKNVSNMIYMVWMIIFYPPLKKLKASCYLTLGTIRKLKQKGNPGIIWWYFPGMNFKLRPDKL